MSGESASPARPAAVALSSQPLSLDALVALVSHAGAGAVATFVGAVRTKKGIRHAARVRGYESMARAENGQHRRRVEAEMMVCARPFTTASALGVGDVAVVCAASAPHRGEAFALSILIDRVKARVPIWKREHGPDGRTGGLQGRALSGMNDTLTRTSSEFWG